MAKCPECGALIDLEEDEAEEGEIISCPECAVELEVVNTHPLEFDVIEEEEEEEEEAEEPEGEEEGDLDDEDEEPNY